jgi:hypothetical protein
MLSNLSCATFELVAMVCCYIITDQLPPIWPRTCTTDHSCVESRRSYFDDTLTQHAPHTRAHTRGSFFCTHALGQVIGNTPMVKLNRCVQRPQRPQHTLVQESPVFCRESWALHPTDARALVLSQALHQPTPHHLHWRTHAPPTPVMLTTSVHTLVPPTLRLHAPAVSQKASWQTKCL